MHTGRIQEGACHVGSVVVLVTCGTVGRRKSDVSPQTIWRRRRQRVQVNLKQIKQVKCRHLGITASDRPHTHWPVDGERAPHGHQASAAVGADEALVIEQAVRQVGLQHPGPTPHGVVLLCSGLWHSRTHHNSTWSSLHEA